MNLHIYDTTLRDGAQGEGVSFSVEDKLRVTRKLDALGFAFIEGGWPGSNPKDAAYFRKARALPLRRSVLAAFSFCGRVGVPPEEDAVLAALLEAGTSVVTIVGKSRVVHVEKVLGTTLEENLRLIRDNVRFLREQGRRVFYDAEQFFDGYKEDSEYAMRTIEAAREGGAEVVILCDTNGGTMPWEVERIVREVRDRLAMPLGIHAHNDGELAVANTLAAVRAGAVQVQGTVNGYGERVGNANLCSILPNLQLKMGHALLGPGELRDLTDTARFVGELAGILVDSHAPYVGRSAFAHKAGLHADATMKLRESYQHVHPGLVGNASRILVSELAGKGNVLMKADELGLAAGLSVDQARAVARSIKDLENDGWSFEGADASVGLLVRRASGGYRAPFQVVEFGLTSEHRTASRAAARAMVSIAGVLHEIRGEGPEGMHAIEDLFRRGLGAHFPALEKVEVEGWRTQVVRPRDPPRCRAFLTAAVGERRATTSACAADAQHALARAMSDACEALLPEV